MSRVASRPARRHRVHQRWWARVRASGPALRDVAVAALTQKLKELTMSARRIAVLVGSHDPAYFARHTQPERPSEAAVLTALRAQRSTSEANRRASAHPDPDGSRQEHCSAALALAPDAGTRRAHAPDSGGPPRISVLAAAARTRSRPAHARASSRPGPPARDARRGGYHEPSRLHAAYPLRPTGVLPCFPANPALPQTH